ncbi:hypothetical protein H8S90_13265 [Olivibacter sp. SDN3]|uniref:hypothetical protein n=1 Tax=Olivibacter sp. SDN3 TaxID=2764720 RepID=UPI001650EE31|nr:hypothetical protein [Olivibacter sp. SDN3]QNL47791.1 hypothetical protein H8S90_13265 [Olivibacter sp. SDN3]
MKQTALLTLLSIYFSLSWCQAYSKQDSTGYEKQRERVNNLLQKRSQRFGEFDASLQSRTGIFGLKTKKDMQASIDILEEIVTTDNYIFKETKALLDFKDIEKQTIASQATESGERITGYINTISKLQKNQDALNREINILKKQRNIYINLLLFATTALLIVIFLLIRRSKKLTLK